MKPLVPLVLCLVMAACGAPPHPAKVMPLAVPSVPAPGPAQGAPGPRVPRSVPPQAPPPRVFDESLLRGREFLLETESRPAVVQDRILGPLGGQSSVVEAARRWLEAVRSKPWDDTLVEARWSAYLQAWAGRYQKDLGTGPIIVGEPLVQTGVDLVPVRISNSAVDWTGWVVLVPGNPGWLVSDVQLLSQAADTSPFNPEGSRQLISSPIRR